MNAKELDAALAEFDRRWQNAATGPKPENFACEHDYVSALADWMTRHDEARAFLVRERDTALWLERWIAPRSQGHSV